jgi:rare lipoprotein A
MIVGGLLILASIALGAGSEGWDPGAPGVQPDAPELPIMDALPRGDAVLPGLELPAAEPIVAPLEEVELLPADSVETVRAGDALLVVEGSASWYSDALAGRRTASGEPYDPRELIAAHRALPFGTRLRVTNLSNDRTVEVRVIDRGPFVAGRILDLSRSAAEQIGIVRVGHARVRVEVLEYGS